MDRTRRHRRKGPGAAARGARAVVLLSGGLDSATCLAIARAEGYDCYALSFSCGQRHGAELAAATRVAGALGAIEIITHGDRRWM